MTMLEMLKRHDAMHEVEEPILLSSETYRRMQSEGYIDENGEFTDKTLDAIADYWQAAFRRVREEAQ